MGEEKGTPLARLDYYVLGKTKRKTEKARKEEKKKKNEKKEGRDELWRPQKAHTTE